MGSRPAKRAILSGLPKSRRLFGYIWAVSSVGQSTCFTRRGSEVQVLYRPPLFEARKALMLTAA